MSISILKNEKTSDGLGDFYVDDWKEKRGIEISILHLISGDFQRPNKGFTGLKEQNQYNEPSFSSPVRSSNTKNQYWVSENWLHYSEDLQDGSLYFFPVRSGL